MIAGFRTWAMLPILIKHSERGLKDFQRCRPLPNCRPARPILYTGTLKRRPTGLAPMRSRRIQ
jgi:hypothetical protein